jgi:hypothetical protein
MLRRDGTGSLYNLNAGRKWELQPLYRIEQQVNRELRRIDPLS